MRLAEKKHKALMRALLRLRRTYRLSQEDMAAGCGLTRQGYGLMEGAKRWSSQTNVLRACASLRIPLWQLALLARC
jgi:DNA-binding XRE family transcriptional regulator